MNRTKEREQIIGYLLEHRERPLDDVLAEVAQGAHRPRKRAERITVARRRKRLCLDCGTPTKPRVRCDSCRLAANAQGRERMQARRRAGICVRCQAAALPEKTLCAKHLEEMRVRTRVRKQPRRRGLQPGRRQP